MPDWEFEQQEVAAIVGGCDAAEPGLGVCCRDGGVLDDRAAGIRNTAANAARDLLRCGARARDHDCQEELPCFGHEISLTK